MNLVSAPLVFPKVAEVPEEVIEPAGAGQPAPSGVWTSGSVRTVLPGELVALGRTIQGVDFISRARYNGGHAFTVHEDGFYAIDVSPEYAGALLDKKTNKPLVQPLTAGTTFVIVSMSNQPALWELTVTKAG